MIKRGEKEDEFIEKCRKRDREKSDECGRFKRWMCFDGKIERKTKYLHPYY